MKNIYAKDYGISPGKEVAAELSALIGSLVNDENEKTLVFEKGVYYLDSDKVLSPVLYVTNTMGDKEWLKGEKAHLNKVGMLFEGIRSLRVEGNEAVFVARGRMTNIAIRNCADLCLKNIILVTENPDMHVLKVIGKGLCHIDFELDRESRYGCKKGKYYFVGKDYVSAFAAKKFKAYWIGRIPAGSGNEIKRSSHPLRGAISFCERSPRVFRARYPIAPRYSVGDEFCIFDVRRKYQGIFIEKSRNVVLDKIVQHFNYGLACVFQDSENICVKNSEFSPEENAAKKMASVADFVQVCCCRGEVRIEDNFFCGAGDDCLNVHGIHFAVKEAKGNVLTLKFMHPQSHGFCPFSEGDILSFVDRRTLLPVARAEVKSAELVNEYRIKLVLTEAPCVSVVGTVAENTSACPDVTFTGNTLDRVITRGLLITTSGKVRIENNDFCHTAMHAILVSDDANSWYESGPVRNITITNNRFLANKGRYICVKPENKVHKGYVHRGIRAKNNFFASPASEGFYFKSTAESTVKDNVFSSAPRMRIINSEVETDITEIQR